MNYTQVPLYTLQKGSEFYLWDNQGKPCKQLHYKVLDSSSAEIEEAILVQHEETGENRLLYSWVNCWVSC